MAAEEAASGAAHHGGGLAIDPMHQFRIETIFPFHIGGVDASFTNSALWMVIAGTLITLLTVAGMGKRSLVPGRIQSVAELSYEFVANMLRDNVGDAGKRFFPFVFTLFMFVLFTNMLGMVPYSFTVTSHIIVTFALAMFIFLGVTIVGFAVHGLHYFGLVVPKGVPVLMLPLLIVIETISYLTRPISLSVRLFANMMAGHTMLKVFAGFVIAMGYMGGFLPLAFMVAFTGLEILVAFLQAYVFAILTCIYLNDALHMH
ncbi:F0F1 ATP synthase subunit A [Parvibaculum sp.]|uniref:F0F1 ATP synthase subunit A n=1 Tax=Parvibaculum sp. TaxID=2024848 RepID=UPI0025F41209|nr:F0F1 ATP synthase subunit A [Parvibaculum sp.]